MGFEPDPDVLARPSLRATGRVRNPTVELRPSLSLGYVSAGDGIRTTVADTLLPGLNPTVETNCSLRSQIRVRGMGFEPTDPYGSGS